MINYDVHNEEWVNAQLGKPYLYLLFHDYLEQSQLSEWKRTHKAIHLWIHPEGLVHSDVNPVSKRTNQLRTNHHKSHLGLHLSPLSGTPQRGVTIDTR